MLGVSTDLFLELGDETVEREKTQSDEVQWLSMEGLCGAKGGRQVGRGTPRGLQVFQDKLMKLGCSEEHPSRQCCWELLFPSWLQFSHWKSSDIGSECVSDWKFTRTIPCS